MSALLNAMLLNALAATALAVVVWVTGVIPSLRRRPGLRHGLWIVVLLKLVTPPLFEMPILPGWLVANPVPILPPKAISLRPELSSLTVPNAAGSDWLWIAALVSGFGTLTVLTFATGQIWRLRRALRGGATNDERLSRIGGLAADRMGLAVVPTVCVVAANVSPLLWVRRSGPLIVLPRRLVEQLTDEQLGCVLSHEIAHYLRRDHWTNLLSLMVGAACWWNPIAWWARRELRMAQEACCDALVISRAVASRRKYAETLLQALEFIQAERSLLPALASGLGRKSSTERRFEMITNTRVSHRLSWRNYALLVAALATLPCLLTFAEAQEEANVTLQIVDTADVSTLAILARSPLIIGRVLQRPEIRDLKVIQTQRVPDHWLHQVLSVDVNHETRELRLQVSTDVRADIEDIRLLLSAIVDVLGEQTARSPGEVMFVQKIQRGDGPQEKSYFERTPKESANEQIEKALNEFDSKADREAGKDFAQKQIERALKEFDSKADRETLKDFARKQIERARTEIDRQTLKNFARKQIEKPRAEIDSKRKE